MSRQAPKSNISRCKIVISSLPTRVLVQASSLHSLDYDSTFQSGLPVPGVHPLSIGPLESSGVLVFGVFRPNQNEHAFFPLLPQHPVPTSREDFYML